MNENDTMTPREEAKSESLQETLEADMDLEELSIEEQPRRATGILLLLLLVAIAAGGYLYLSGSPPQSDSATVSGAVKGQIMQPAPPRSGTIAQDDDSQEAGEPSSEGKKAVPTLAATSEAPETGAPSQQATAESPPVTKDTPASEPALARYRLESASFLLPSSVKNAELAIGRLGYEPVFTPVEKEVKMTRLRLGVFAPEEAETMLKDLDSKIVGGFSMPAGEKTAVYAGSYYSLDKARAYADYLYELGIEVQEETTEVPMTFQRLSFGAFPDRESAAAAMEKVQNAGFEARILPFP